MLELPNPWQIAARSVGPVGRDAIARASRGRIEAVFATSFYIATDAGMVGVGHEDMYDGPLNIVTDAPRTTDWQASGLRPGQPAAVSPSTIRVGPSLVLSLAGASNWRPVPTPVPYGPGDLSKALAVLPAPKHLPDAARQRIQGLEGAFSVAFRSGRLFHPDRADVAALAGMGPGLTPAGDDVLGGMMIACHALGAPGFAEDLWRVLEPIALRTGNSISAAHLKAASLGMGAAGLHDLLRDLLAGIPIGPGHLAAMDRVGHTSGWDALAGATAVIRAMIAAGSEISPSSGVA